MVFTKDTNKTKDMNMENRNNHKNQKTVKTDKTVKTASAIFSESLKSLKSLMPFFANNEKKGSRVKKGEAPTNLQLISFLSPTTVSTSSRKWEHIAAMVAMLLIIGVGDVWGVSTTVTTTSGTSWTVDGRTWTAATDVEGGTSYLHMKSNSSNITVNSTISMDLSGSNTVTVTVGAGSYGGNQASVTAKLVKSDGTTISNVGSAQPSTNGNKPYTITLTPTNRTITDAKVVIGVSGATSGSKYIRLYSFTITYTALVTKCATPTFSVAGGTYTTSKSVTLGCSTTGATIRYTTDGTDPTGSSTAYSSAITVDASKTIKAKAFKDGLTASDVASATYTIKCATPTFSVAGGTKNNDVDVTLSTTFGTSIYYTTDGTTPTTNSTLYSSAITVNATQTINAIAVKSGCSDSDGASATYTMVCANPLLSKTTSTNYNDFSVTITTATTDGVIRYTLDGNDPTESSAVYSSAIEITATKTLKAKVFKTGYTASSVASATYTMTCATPTYSANAGTFTGPTAITLSTTTEGATIYYTTDGSTPSSSSIEYTGGDIAINVTTTIKIIAIKDGYNNSSVPTQKTYTIKCAQPVASPAAGTYSGPQDIELSTTYGDKIYYTMTEDGTAPGTPSASSTEYTGPIHMTVVTKIKAIAWKDGCSNSNQLGGSYGDTYTIQYNVTWMVDGEEWSDQGGSSTVNGGGHITTLPTAPTTGDFCGDRFMGWTDAEGGAYVHGSSGLYTTASGFPNATGDQVFYAVFADYAE